MLGDQRETPLGGQACGSFVKYPQSPGICSTGMVGTIDPRWDFAVGESPFPLVIGVIGGSPMIYALALSTTPDKIPEVWEKGQRHPIDPAAVKSGLCKEIIARGAEVDLGILPQVVWTPGQDPGPYITAPVIITKDVETGQRNVGTYRLQIKGPRQLGLYVGAAQHAAKHIRQYEAQKQDMPLAIAVGVDPAIVLASISKFPYAAPMSFQ